jgi:hypothetical protein
MNCKKCGKPVEKAIEGECICVDCWTLAQMSVDDIQAMKEREWFDTHCPGCEQTFKTKQEKEAGYCKACQQGNKKLIAEVYQ